MKLKNKIKILKFSKKSKGFSLIEVLVAMFIFLLAISLLIGGFSSFFKNYIVAKKIQKDVENAQYAMNFMAKTLRTSALITTTPPITAFPFRAFDYSQTANNCIEYNYSSSMITSSSVTKADPDECSAAPMPTATALTSNDITGAHITAIPTISSNYGKVTIVLYVQDQSSTVNQPSAIPIQMSVSLRQ